MRFSHAMALALALSASMIGDGSAHALGIQDLPGLVEIDVCVRRNPSVIECNGAFPDQLQATPDAMIHVPFLSLDPPRAVSIGLSDQNGDLSAGDTHLRIDVQGGPVSLIRAVLQFANPSVIEFPILIMPIGVVTYGVGQSDANLVALLQQSDEVSIVSGTIVLSFSSVPEPSTALLMSLGLVGLTTTKGGV